MSHCCKSESNCVCCNKTRIKASWDNCLNSCGKDNCSPPKDTSSKPHTGADKTPG